jgi:hypothetical protein
MKINIRSNAKQVAKRMGKAGSKQIPFATKNAVNDTLFDMRKEITASSFNRSFPTAPNKQFIKSSMRVEKAKNKQRPEGSVFDRFGYDWLERQAVGGGKRPKSSRTLAVPRYGPGLKRTAKGPSKVRRPGVLMKQRGKYFSGKPKGILGASAGIWQRMGSKGRKKVRQVYTFTPRADVRKAFTGYEDALVVARRTFGKNMKRSLAKALKTSR